MTVIHIGNYGVPENGMPQFLPFLKEGVSLRREDESSVIYAGKPARESDIEYVNADDYLENLGQPEKKRCRLRERPA